MPHVPAVFLSPGASALSRGLSATPAQAAFIKQSALALSVSLIIGPDSAAIVSLNAGCNGLLNQGDFAFFECARKVVGGRSGATLPLACSLSFQPYLFIDIAEKPFRS